MAKPTENRLALYMKPDDYELLQKCGRGLYAQGYPVLKSNGDVNNSAVVAVILRLAMNVEVKKVK